MGIRRARPPRRSRSRSPVAANTDPAAKNPRLLKAAWAIRCNSAAAIATAAAAVAPEVESSVAAPKASAISPMSRQTTGQPSYQASSSSEAWLFSEKK